MLERLRRIARHGEEAPRQTAGGGVVGRDVAAHGVLRAAVADDHLALHDARCAGDRVRLLQVDRRLHVPHGGAGVRVQRHQPAVEQAHEDEAVVERHATVHGAAAQTGAAGRRKLRVPRPLHRAGARIEREHRAPRPGRVEHAVRHQRRGFERAGHAEFGGPRACQPRRPSPRRFASAGCSASPHSRGRMTATRPRARRRSDRSVTAAGRDWASTPAERAASTARTIMVRRIRCGTSRDDSRGVGRATATMWRSSDRSSTNVAAGGGSARRAAAHAGRRGRVAEERDQLFGERGPEVVDAGNARGVGVESSRRRGRCRWPRAAPGSERSMLSTTVLRCWSR